MKNKHAKLVQFHATKNEKYPFIDKNVYVNSK